MRRAKTAIGIFVLMAWVLFPVGSSFAQDAQEFEWPGQATGQGVAQQQEEPSPEEVAQMMQTMMVPMMGQMMQVMIKSMAETLAEQEIADHFASYTRNFYNALMDRGFTQEEALKIVTSSGFPSVGGAQQ